MSARRLQRAKRVLHDAIFERVERQNHESPARCQPRGGAREKAVQSFELAIDPDANRLKRARRRIDACVSLAWNGSPHDVRQLPRRLDQSRLLDVDDRARHAPRVTLLTELVDHVCERLLVDGCQHLGRGRSTRCIHAHVERLVPPEAEAATWRVELQRRHTQIRQHPVDVSDTPCVQHVFETAIVRVDDFNCAAGVAQCFACVCERVVDRDRAL